MKSNGKILNGLFRILDNHLIRVSKKHNITIIDIVVVDIDVGVVSDYYLVTCRHYWNSYCKYMDEMISAGVAVDVDVVIDVAVVSAYY